MNKFMDFSNLCPKDINKYINKIRTTTNLIEDSTVVLGYDPNKFNTDSIVILGYDTIGKVLTSS